MGRDQHHVRCQAFRNSAVPPYWSFCTAVKGVQHSHSSMHCVRLHLKEHKYGNYRFTASVHKQDQNTQNVKHTHTHARTHARTHAHTHTHKKEERKAQQQQEKTKKQQINKTTTTKTAFSNSMTQEHGPTFCENSSLNNEQRKVYVKNDCRNQNKINRCNFE